MKKKERKLKPILVVKTKHKKKNERATHKENTEKILGNIGKDRVAERK